jgi:hypothetical protein
LKYILSWQLDSSEITIETNQLHESSVGMIGAAANIATVRNFFAGGAA